MAFLLTRAAVKSQLQIPAGITFHDARIDALLDAADRAVMMVCQIPALTVNTYSEKIDIDGSDVDTIKVKRWPVVSVAAITDDGALVSADDYYLHNEGAFGRINLVSNTFSEGRQKVQITYSAGWATPPAEMVQAGMMWTCWQFNRTPQMGLSSEKVPGLEVTFSLSDIPPEMNTLLARYKRVFA